MKGSTIAFATEGPPCRPATWAYAEFLERRGLFGLATPQSRDLLVREALVANSYRAARREAYVAAWNRRQPISWEDFEAVRPPPPGVPNPDIDVRKLTFRFPIEAACAKARQAGLKRLGIVCKSWAGSYSRESSRGAEWRRVDRGRPGESIEIRREPIVVEHEFQTITVECFLTDRDREGTYADFRASRWGPTSVVTLPNPSSDRWSYDYRRPSDRREAYALAIQELIRELAR